jgi:hypothetical protein
LASERVTYHLAGPTPQILVMDLGGECVQVAVIARADGDGD